MHQRWSADELFEPAVTPKRNTGNMRGTLLLIGGMLLVGTATGPVLQKAGYAMQSGRLQAEREYLDSLPQSVMDLEKLSSAFHHIAQVIKPSVVSIRSERIVRAPSDAVHNAIDRFGPGDSRVTNVGSGVVFEADGYIVTSYHVVQGAGNVEIELFDGRVMSAEVAGTDPMTDLAVLKVDATDLQPARFGDSDATEVGHIVLAVGSPFRLSQTVSQGIISAKGRREVKLDIDYQDFLQTDAAINPGNSGGPLVNTRGQVVGINTAIATESGTFAGVAFATPSNKVIEIAQVLKTGSRVQRGYLGVEIGEPRDKTTSGVIITNVLTNGPADKGGLRKGDVVLSIEGKPIDSSTTLQELVAASKPGDSRKFKINRRGRDMTIDVEIGAQPKGFRTIGSLGLEIEAIGMQVNPLSADTIARYGLEKLNLSHGALITQITEEGPADQLGLKPGDVIVSVNSSPVESYRDLRTMLSADQLVKGVKVRVESSTGPREIDLKIDSAD